MEGRRISRLVPALTLLLISFAFFQIRASEIFYESFDEPFEGRWVVSEKDDYKEAMRGMIVSEVEAMIAGKQ